MHPRRQEIFPFPFLSNYKLNSLWDEQNCYLYNIVTVRCHLEAINEVLQSKIVIVCQHTYKIIQGRNNLKWKNKYLQPYMNSNDFSSRVNMQISVKKKKKKTMRHRQKISGRGNLYRASSIFRKLRVNWIPSYNCFLLCRKLHLNMLSKIPWK